jgi:hypothetical protein
VQINGGKGMEVLGEVPAAAYLTAFRLENCLPVWTYEVKVYTWRNGRSWCTCRTPYVTYDALSDQARCDWSCAH